MDDTNTGASDVNAATQSADVDVTNEQVEKYFESKGEITPDTVETVEEAESQGEEAEERESEVETEEAEESTADVDDDEVVDAEINGNYKKAMKAERYKRKEVQKKAHEYEQRMRDMESQLEQYQSHYQQQQTATQQQEIQSKTPDKDVDPIGYLEWQNENLQAALQQQQDYLSGQAQQEQQSQQQNQFVNSYKQAANDYSKKTPDFADAYQHLMKSRMTEYQAAGYSETEAGQLLNQDEQAIVSKAFTDGVNPAERMYSLAKARGYNVAPPKLDAINRGVKNSRSLSGMSGGTTGTKNRITAENVDNLTTEELDQLFDQMKTDSGGTGIFG